MYFLTILEKINIEDYVKDLCDNDIELKDTLKKSFKSYVGLNFQKYLKDVNVKLIRKNVTIPSWLNEVAKRNNINFSKILQEALEKELEIE